jgi:hypothetical protein
VLSSRVSVDVTTSGTFLHEHNIEQAMNMGIKNCFTPFP